jgi:hypothetical protein
VQACTAGTPIVYRGYSIRNGGKGQERTNRPTSRVSKECLRKIRFSLLAHAILSTRVSIWICRLLGMGAKKSRRVRTFILVNGRMRR